MSNKFVEILSESKLIELFDKMPVHDHLRHLRQHRLFTSIPGGVSVARTEFTIIAGPRMISSLPNPHEARRLLKFFKVNPDLNEHPNLKIQFVEDSGCDDEDEGLAILKDDQREREDGNLGHLVYLRKKAAHVFFEALSRFCPNVEALTVIITSEWPFLAQRQLLANWPKLKTLRLINLIDDDYFDYRRLGPQLHQYQSLQHLSINHYIDIEEPCIEMRHIEPLILNNPLEEVLISIFDYEHLTEFSKLWTPDKRYDLTELGFCCLNIGCQEMIMDDNLLPLYTRLTRVHGKIPAVFGLTERRLAYWIKVTYMDLAFNPVVNFKDFLYKLLLELSVIRSLVDLRISLDSLLHKLPPPKIDLIPQNFNVKKVQLSAYQDPHHLMRDVAQQAFPTALKSQGIKLRYSAEMIKDEFERTGQRDGETLFCDKCDKDIRQLLVKEKKKIEAIYFCLQPKLVPNVSEIEFSNRMQIKVKLMDD